jgi:coenzyme F420-reducing hydrogenase delta subunit
MLNTPIHNGFTQFIDVAFEHIYYDLDSLEEYIEGREEDTLVITCKGSTPAIEGIKEITGLSESDFIPLVLSCVGRVRMEFIMKAITLGKKVVLMPCEEDYCRFEEGSRLLTRKVAMLIALLKMFGYGPDIVTLERKSVKVDFDRYKCIGCGNCEAFCPYDAAHLVSPKIADFDLDKCMGCGICMVVCPAHAVEFKNWEHEHISSQVREIASEGRTKVLIFCCQWCEFSSLDEMLQRPLPEGVQLIPLPCAGRADPLHILQALKEGIGGVMITACPEEECKLEEGSKTARYYVIEKLMEKLEQIGLEDRAYLCYTSPKYVEQFDKELQSFMARIGERRIKKN